MSTIKRIELLSAPAILSAPHFSLAKNAWLIKIAGTISQIERSNEVIVEVLKEKRSDGIIRHLINFGKDAIKEDFNLIKVQEILVPDHVFDKLSGKRWGTINRIQSL